MATEKSDKKISGELEKALRDVEVVTKAMLSQAGIKLSGKNPSGLSSETARLKDEAAHSKR